MATTTRVLMIADDPGLFDMLAERGAETASTDSVDPVRQWARFMPDLVVADLDLVAPDPLELLRVLRTRVDPGRVLLLAGPRSLGSVAEAARIGLPWYQKKPVDPIEIGLALDRVRDGHARNVPAEPVTGSSPNIQSALRLAAQAAGQDRPLTITGEPGVGKRLIGRLVHERSGRARNAFGQISCVGLSQSVADGELFGRDGLLQRCHRGTLMIDEIAGLPAACQHRLLKYVKSEKPRRMGVRADVRPSDVRVIVSSSEPIEDHVRSGSLLEALFDRIGGVRIELQPLRERKSDIPVLADCFLRQAGQRSGRSFKGVTPEALDLLLRHGWPGNVRELEEMMARAADAAAGPWLTAEDLPALPVTGHSVVVPGSTIQEIEKEAILRTLEAQEGSTGRAARILNMSVRKIQYKLKEYRRESAATLRSETVRGLPVPAGARPARAAAKKNAVFVRHPR